MNNTFEYKEEYGWLTNICLNVTDACNLACRYCFVEQHPHYMTYEIAEKAVYFILDNLEKKRIFFNNPNLTASIAYFGGEPTILWNEIIVPLTDWIRKNNFPIELGMTTNGTLLNEERIKYLYDNQIIPLLSIDGDRATQEYNRPCLNSSQSSFDLIQQNIPILLRYFPDLTFRGTIYSETAKETFNNYLFAIDNGFKNVFFMPDHRHDWTQKEQEELKQEVNKIFSFMDYCFTNGEIPVNFSTINESFERMLKRDLLVLKNNDFQIDLKRDICRCGLGTAMGAIGYDGSIYGCQEQPSKDKKNIFLIGDIFSGIDKEKHNALLYEYGRQAITHCEDKKLCENCLLRTQCIGFNCPSSSYDLFGNFFISAKINCLWLQWIFQNCLILNNKLVTENNLLFQDFLLNNCNFNKYFKQKEEKTNYVN